MRPVPDSSPIQWVWREDSEKMADDPKYACVFIDQDDPEFASHVDRIADSLSKRAVVPFLGAGISVAPPANMPQAMAIMERIRKALWEAASDLVNPEDIGTEDLAAAERVIDGAPLERLLWAMDETHGRELTIDRYLEPLQGTIWNANHAALASLANAGRLSVCITLNFDLLIERAVEGVGGSSLTECPLGSARRRNDHATGFSLGSDSPYLRIIKPHGSFAPTESDFEPAEFIATTLPEIGDRPDPRNRSILAEVLPEGTEMLVAGYSDDDWDIFPIIRELAPRLKHIHWVHFANSEKVRDKISPWQGTGNVREQRIRQWLVGQPTPFTSYVGDVSHLLGEVCRRMRLSPASVPDASIRQKPVDASIFLTEPRPEIARARSAVSMAILLQDRGRYNDILLKRLHHHPVIRADRLLKARVHEVSCYTLHTRREVRRAMQHMKKAIGLKYTQGSPAARGLPEDLVWLGYEHFCLLKRPGLSLPLWWFHMGKGKALMLQGIHKARHGDPALARKLLGLARYYRTDLRHAWMGHLLFLGANFRGFIRFVARPIAARYEKLQAKHPDLMAWDYYWLRGLEAQFLAGDVPKNKGEWNALDQKMSEIERRYEILQNHVQSGNPAVFRALIAHVRTGAVRVDLLDAAEEQWGSADGVATSGLYRVSQYRRFLGVERFFPFIWRSFQRMAQKPARSNQKDTG